MQSPPKFLVLLDAAAQRALLFDVEQRLLGEVIEDDGYIVDCLLSGARACPLPEGDMLAAVMPPPSPQSAPRCYELG